MTGLCPQLETRAWEEARVGPWVGLLHPSTLLGLDPPRPGPAAQHQHSAGHRQTLRSSDSRSLPLDTGGLKGSPKPCDASGNLCPGV